MGWAVAYEGAPVSIKNGLRRACGGAGVTRCSGSPRRAGCARPACRRWEVAVQLGHSVGKEYAVTERHALHSPDYLSGAIRALDGLIRLVVIEPVGR
jgi:hypothetical protein